MNFNKSTVATLVGVALTTMALGAVAAPSQLSQSFKTTKFPTHVFNAKQQTTVNKATVSGMRNEIDKSTGIATFQWAGINQAKPDMGAIAPEFQLSYAADFYLNKLQGVSTAKSSNLKPVLSMVHDLGRGAKIAKYKQEISGIEVFNREFNIMMDANFGLVASSGYFADKKIANSAAATLKGAALNFGDASKAITAAYAAMGGNTDNLELVAITEKGKYQQFNVVNTQGEVLLVGTPRAKKVFFETKGFLSLAYYVEVETSQMDSVDSQLFSYVVDAQSGEILFKNNLTTNAEKFNYRAYADETGKPWDSPHGNVIPAPADADPAAFLTAPYLAAPMISITNSPFSQNDAWLADDATVTAGNNVAAYVDAIAPDGFSNGDLIAETTSANTFDYAYNDSEGEYSLNNRKAAVVNLFLMVNYLHDDFYDHGFDEASGNAQADNYGRGGYEGDPLRAEAQDNSGFNNANMSTPADGFSPRMQMFLWDKATAANGVDWGLTVTAGADSLGLLQTTRVGALGPATFAEFSGKLVRLEDGTDPVNDGCESAINGADLAGNIAVIDRGVCNFSVKVLNAQAEGAIAVIVANNRDGDVAFTMGGDSTGITIPNVMISQNEGTALYAAMATNDVVVSMFSNEVARAFKGSSWDNGIVAHEWGHYISNRLVGNSNGLINNQGGSMGEGWGDFHALLVLADADESMMVGNEMFGTAYSATSYVASFSTGIRRVPYSTDMDINPLTFRFIEFSAEVHDSGEIWASMLWDSYVALINDDRHTFKEARGLMMDYLVAGYKMTPIAPTFTEARDAILAAAYANDPEDYKLILAAFARRGMGLGAVSPSRFSTDHFGVVESYETDLASFNVTAHSLDANYEGLTSGFCSNDNILDKGETGTVSFTVANNGSQALSGVVGKVEVISGQDVTLANDGMVTFGDVALFGSATSSPIEFTLNEAATADTLAFKVSFPDLDASIRSSEYSFATTVNIDFTDRAPVDHASGDDMETAATLHDFSENVMVGGDMAKGTGFLDTRFATFFRQNILDIGDQYLFINNNSFESDVAYQTRSFEVGFSGDFVIDWFHYYDFEETWDGGVVEVSVNGGAWADVTEMGGQYLGNGYLNSIDSRAGTAIAGKPAFTGFDVNFEAVSFGQSLNGNQVKFRFRTVTDSNTNSFGWIIDGVNVSNINTTVYSDLVSGDTFACDNRLPFATISSNATVNEGGTTSLSVDASDPNSDALTYSWVQTSGVAATLANADTATVSITAPQIAAEQTLKFEVTISDGTGSVTRSAAVTVKTVAPVVEPQKSSGGGSTGLLALLLLPLAMFRRRK